jgi:trimethylamine--corrinoid protein Co-methyltransferase
LGDVLPELNVVGAMADPQEIDISFRCVQVAAQQIKTTTKPILFWFYNRATARFIVELFSALRGSSEDAKRYPVSYPLFEPISPLRFPKDGIELLFEISKINLPVAIGPMVQAGLTGPVTLAGTLVLQTAEVLAGICITQLINPGTPICFGGICHAFDMRNTQIIFGGPEQALMSAASVEIAHYYGFPAYTNSGLTDSKCPDAQAGLEIAATMLSAAFAGSDIFGHLGICGADQAASLETLLLQHEVISYIEHIMKGINTEYENICVELINDTGPGGSFIESMHTAEHYKEELWFPNLLNRDSWSAWKDKGRLSLQDTLPGCLQELLDSYEQKPLPKETLNDMNQIVDEAAKY